MEFRLAEYRQRKGLSQLEFAKLVGKGLRTIQAWEAGNSYPNAEYLCLCARILDTTPNQLVDWDDERTSTDCSDASSMEGELLDEYHHSSAESQNAIVAFAHYINSIGMK